MMAAPHEPGHKMSDDDPVAFCVGDVHEPLAGFDVTADAPDCGLDDAQGCFSNELSFLGLHKRDELSQLIVSSN